MTDRNLLTDPRARRREAKRIRIVEAAWELAHRDGLAAISLRDVADQVDLRQPSLYAYFGSKLDLYDALFADGYRQLLRISQARPSLADPHEDLVDFTATMVRFSSEDAVRHQMLFQRTIPGFEPSPGSMALAYEFYDVGINVLAAAGLTDQADVDLYTALVSGFAHQQVANDPGGERWIRLVRASIEMLVAREHRAAAATSSRKGKS